MKKEWLIEGTSDFEFNVEDEINFGLIWDGNVDPIELLESGAIAVWYKEDEDYLEVIFDFEVITENKEEPWKTKVKITNIV